MREREREEAPAAAAIDLVLLCVPPPRSPPRVLVRADLQGPARATIAPGNDKRAAWLCELWRGHQVMLVGWFFEGVCGFFPVCVGAVDAGN